jgi:hypothetical protein
MLSDSSMRRVMWRSYTRLDTNKLCTANTSATCTTESSRLVTRCSDEFKATRIGISSRPRGRGHSSSIKCSDQEHSNFSTRTAGLSPTHGT